MLQKCLTISIFFKAPKTFLDLAYPTKIHKVKAADFIPIFFCSKFYIQQHQKRAI